MNYTVPLIPVTLIIEKSFQIASRFCFPYFFTRENTIEQRDSYETIAKIIAFAETQ